MSAVHTLTNPGPSRTTTPHTLTMGALGVWPQSAIEHDVTCEALALVNLCKEDAAAARPVVNPCQGVVAGDLSAPAAVVNLCQGVAL